MFLKMQNVFVHTVASFWLAGFMEWAPHWLNHDTTKLHSHTPTSMGRTENTFALVGLEIVHNFYVPGFVYFFSKTNL